MASPLLLDAKMRARLVALAEAAYPAEGCGLLVGATGATGGTRVTAVLAAANRERDRPHARFELDPRDLLAAERDARAAGFAVVGAWHSHPDRDARPSRADRDGALAGWSHVIVAVRAGRAQEVRAWVLRDADLVEQDITAPRPGAGQAGDPPAVAG